MRQIKRKGNISEENRYKLYKYFEKRKERGKKEKIFKNKQTNMKYIVSELFNEETKTKKKWKGAREIIPQSIIK